GVVHDPLPHARLITIGPDRFCFLAVELETGQLASDVPRGHDLTCGRLDEERADAVLGAGDDHRPIRGVAVDDEGLLPCQTPAAALAPRAGSHRPPRIAGPGLFERDRAACRAGRERAELIVESEVLGG